MMLVTRSLRRRGLLSSSCLMLQRVDLKLIQELRYRTDAPISDCSAALKACNLDLDEAAVWLRKKGIAKANKKGGRVTDNGMLVAALDGQHGGGIVTMCSETDFACRNEKFAAAACAVKEKFLGMVVATQGAALENPEEALAELTRLSSDILASAISVLGENLTLKQVTPLRLAPADVEPEDMRQLPLSFGKYTHNACPGDNDVGSIVGLVAVRRLPEAPADAHLSVCDLAQHFVGSSGDTGNYVHQSFLGSEETVGQWLKRHHVKLSASMVMSFGKEPIVTFPSAGRRPNPSAPK